MEGIRIVEGKDKDSSLRVFIVTRGDAGDPLHAPSVPQLELHLLLLHGVDLAVVVQPQGGLAVRGRGEGVAHESPEQRRLPNSILTTKDQLLLWNLY